MKTTLLSLILVSSILPTFGQKVSQFPRTTALNPADLFLVATPGSDNKAIAASDLPAALGVPLASQVQPVSPNLGQAASSTANGYLTASDWNRFNSKGSVSSVGLTMPGQLFSGTVAGSPVIGGGVLSPTLASQQPNTFLAGPASGSPIPPAFRTLTGSDLRAVVTATTAFSSTPYTLTTASANVLGAGQVVLPSAGTYLLMGSVTLNVTTTFPDDPAITVTFQRINNSAAAIGVSRTITLSSYSLASGNGETVTAMVIELPVAVYTTVNANDLISIYGKYAGNGSACYQIADGSLVALRIY